MQSKPTEVTQKPLHASASDTQNSNQHGYRHHHAPAAALLEEEHRAADNHPTPARAAGTDNASPVQDSHQRQRRLSSTSSKSSRRTGSPVDRIIQHEQAVVTLPKRKGEGPAFTVTRPKSPGHPRLNLTDFPNGKPMCVIENSVKLTVDQQRCSLIFFRICHLQPSRTFHLSRTGSTAWSPLHMHGGLPFPGTSRRRRH